MPLPGKKREEYMGKENVEETELRMGAEDFAYYITPNTRHVFSGWARAIKQKGLPAVCIHLHLILMKDAIELGMGMMALLGATNAE